MTVVRMKSRLPMIVADLDDATFAGVKAAADRIVAEAKERAPVGDSEPHLRDAIRVVSDEETDRVEVVAGDDEVWYGHIVEFGAATGQPAQPFLIPAYEKVRPEVEQIVGEELKDLGEAKSVRETRTES